MEDDLTLIKYYCYYIYICIVVELSKGHHLRERNDFWPETRLFLYEEEFQEHPGLSLSKRTRADPADQALLWLE